MKFLISVLFFATLAVSGCAYEATIKSAGAGKQHADHHSVEAKGVCADANALPSNQCAKTITATFDGKGVLWITWVNNEYLYVQSSADKGTSFTAPVRVNAKPEAIAADGESRPKIKLDAQGNIYLTWVLTLDKKRSTYVRFSRSNDGGKRFSEPVTVNDNIEIIRHRFDSLAVGKNGEIFIAWLDARDTEAAKKAGQDFKGLSLYYAWSDDGGAHFYPNKRIATHTCECCRLDTVIAPDNTPVVTWRHIFAGGIRDHALVKFSDWNTPGDTHRLGQDNWKIDACPHHGPGLSIADSGVYHAVWFSNSPTNQGLFYAYSTDSGRHFSTPVNFGKEGAGHPHVLALGSRVNVVWQEFDGTHNVIKLIKSADDGKSWSMPEVIVETALSGDQPFLVSDGQKMYLSWKTQQQDYQLKLIDK
ncbi:MAG: sialidase family protein [Methylobacter sp.]|uniref:Sialidase family protein n=1 Tax=Candidatus Methylobacter titanis TaxID=3053457 RepID=A0AA43TI75_9GAMM|nr:sialidase family protein [Candidatus Methylobacter titanis]